MSGFSLDFVIRDEGLGLRAESFVGASEKKQEKNALSPQEREKQLEIGSASKFFFVFYLSFSSIYRSLLTLVGLF